MTEPLSTGEDHLGDLFASDDEFKAVVAGLEQRGLIAGDGSGYALTDAGRALVKPRRGRK